MAEGDYTIVIHVRKACSEQIDPWAVKAWAEDIMHGCDMVEPTSIQIWSGDRTAAFFEDGQPVGPDAVKKF